MNIRDLKRRLAPFQGLRDKAPGDTPTGAGTKPAEDGTNANPTGNSDNPDGNSDNDPDADDSQGGDDSGSEGKDAGDPSQTILPPPLPGAKGTGKKHKKKAGKKPEQEISSAVWASLALLAALTAYLIWQRRQNAASLRAPTKTVTLPSGRTNPGSLITPNSVIPPPP